MRVHEIVFPSSGLPKGLSIDCGVEVMKVFGALLQGNMSMSNLGSLGTILQSPAGKSKAFV